MIIYW